MSRSIKMIMSGGLGNQLFQVSAGIYLEETLGKEVIFDVANLLGPAKSAPGNYTRSLEIYELLLGKSLITSKPHWLLDLAITKFRKQFLGKYFLFERNQEDRLIFRIGPDTRGIFGFYQDAEIVESAWVSLYGRMKKSEKFSPLVNSNKINRIAIHLRFGDYSDDPQTKKIYGLTKKSYYLEALNEIGKNANSPTSLVIITDNREKASSFINAENFSGPIEYVSSPTAIQDLVELSSSSHVIMSNSTFSWWGAWIANKVHGSQIIYPRPWLADPNDPAMPIYVNNWISIKREYETT